MKEFFGFDGFQRPAEGFLSWQHITFVTADMAVMVALALFFGHRNKNKDIKSKNKVLVFAAILINAVEIFKNVLFCIVERSPFDWLYSLPLFLCSIQFITIPLAAFSKGRVKEASLDFVFIFGMLGAILGTYCAGNNYSVYPVLCFTNVVSAITHGTAGFCALYIHLAKMVSIKRSNCHFTFAILFSFCIAAYIANLFLSTNYMFLMRGDGTPYDIIYNLVNGNPVLYPLLVVVLFIVYIIVFYYVFYHIKNAKNKNGAPPQGKS